MRMRPDFLATTLLASLLVFSLAAALATTVLAQPRVAPDGDEPAPRRAVLERLPEDRTVRIDGDLSEWDLTSLPADRLVELKEQEQVLAVRRPRWTGPQDLSARMTLAFDASYLFVVGRVYDDVLCHENPPAWWYGDSIEIFLDLDRIAARSMVAGESAPLPDSYFQIFLMPINSRRPFGVWQRGAVVVQSSSLFEGVRTAWTATDDGYSFECAIPLANLPGLDRRGAVHGLNVCINDLDGDPDEEGTHAYMIWSGDEGPVNRPDLFRDLEVRDPHSEARSNASDDWREEKDLLLFIGLCATLAAAGLFLSRLAPRIAALPTRAKLGATCAFALLAAALWIIPFLVRSMTLGSERRRFVAGLETVSSALGEVARERLLDPGSEDLEKDLVALLSGNAVPVAPSYTFEHVDLFPQATAPLAKTLRGVPYLDRRLAKLDFSASGYRDEVFHIGMEEPAQEIVLLYTLPSRGPAPGELPPRRELERQPPRQIGTFEIHYHRADPDTIPLVLGRNVDFGITEDPRHLHPEWSASVQPASIQRAPVLGEETFFEVWDQLTFEIPEVKRDAGLDKLVYHHQSARIPFSLLGLTVRLRDAGRAVPVPLALRTRTGVPLTHPQWEVLTTRGYTRDRLALTPPAGQTLSLEIDRPADHVWIVYTGGTEGVEARTPPAGTEKVGKFVLQLDRGTELSIPLVHGESIAPHAFRSLENRLTAPGVGIALTLSNGKSFLQVETPIPEGATIRRLLIEDAGSALEIHVIGVVLGRQERSAQDRLRSSRRLTLGPSPTSFLLGDSSRAQLSSLRFAVLKEDPRLGSPPPTDPGQLQVESSDRGAILRHLLASPPRLGTDLLVAVEQEVAAMKTPSWLIGIRTGLLLLGLPLLLIVATDYLERVRRLRFKLVVTFAAISLVPLILLFAVLSSLTHSRLRSDTSTRLTSRLSELREALSSFERGLREKTREMLARVEEILPDQEGAQPEAPPRPSDPEVQDLLGTLLRKQLPEKPEAWLLLDRVRETSPNRSDGEEERRAVTSPAPRSSFTGFGSATSGRDGLHCAASSLFWLVSASSRIPSAMTWNELRLIYPLGEETLRSLLPSPEGQPLPSLHTLSGIPLLHPPDHGEESALESRAHMRAIASRILQGGGPVAGAGDDGNAQEEAWFDVLRSAEGHPLAVIGVRAPLADLRAFGASLQRSFLVIGSILFLLVVIVGSVLTEKITRPVERLQQATFAIRTGDLGVEIETSSADEVGGLTRAFNSMTRELRSRITELHELSRGAREISTTLQKKNVLAVSQRTLSRLARADRVVFLLASGEDTGRLLVHEIKAGPRHRVEAISRGTGVLAHALEAEEPLLIANPQADLVEGEGEEREAVSKLVAESRTGIILPLSTKGMAGGVLLLYERALSDEDEPRLDLLEAFATHVASALENSRLYELAIQDGTTGFHVRTYFEARLRQEMDRCHGSGRELSLVRLTIDDLRELKRQLGPQAFDDFLRELGAAWRKRLRKMFLVGRTGDGDFEVLMPETSKEEASAIAAGLCQSAREKGIALGPGKKRVTCRLVSGVASAPEDAASAAFLLEAAEKALEAARHRGAAGPLDAEPPSRPRALDQLIEATGFRNEKCLEILETVERIAPSNVTVLILGETGTGKEVIADLIQARSERRDRPFVKINCSALPETLLESELFGHEKGAFTGATQRKLGRFEIAHRGTIFLDEIGDMSLPLQAKLLRVLQDRKIERLGGVESIQVDVRILAATHKDLVQAIATGAFREDLYFRLNVVSLSIPPLRERREEIPVLARTFLEEFDDTHGFSVRGLSPEALDKLHRHLWPGNVRELRNCLERAVLLAQGDVLRADHIQVAEPASPPGARPERRAISGPQGGEPSWELAETARHHDLNPRQVRALEILADRRTVTSAEIARALSVSERTALRDLRDLAEKRLIARTGRTRATRYFLVARDRGAPPAPPA